MLVWAKSDPSSHLPYVWTGDKNKAATGWVAHLREVLVLFVTSKRAFFQNNVCKRTVWEVQPDASLNLSVFHFVCLCPGVLAQGPRRWTPVVGGCQEVNGIQGLPAFRYRPAASLYGYKPGLRFRLSTVISLFKCCAVRQWLTGAFGFIVTTKLVL